MYKKEIFRKDIRHLVNIDSGTKYRNGVNKVGQWFAENFEELGWKINWYEPVKELGRSFLATTGETDHFDLLILCHLDTVFPEGEVKERPFSEDEKRMYGPGVADMKSGCLFTLYTVRELLAENKLSGNVGVFYNAEHEISCPNIRPVIEDLAQKSAAVISAESARPNGAYVKQRKGIGRYKIEFHGRAAHAGNNPYEGACAVTETAHWILFLRDLCDQENGIYVNPGVIEGGMTPNAVPEFARLSIDTRFNSLEDGKRLHNLIMEKKDNPFNPDIKVKIEGNITRPPMVPDENTIKICNRIEKIGDEYGVNVHWAFAGGGSDASFASPLGIPALCGLAGVGGKLHSKDEYLEKEDLEERYKVFRNSVMTIANGIDS